MSQQQPFNVDKPVAEMTTEEKIELCRAVERSSASDVVVDYARDVRHRLEASDSEAGA